MDRSYWMYVLNKEQDTGGDYIIKEFHELPQPKEYNTIKYLNFFVRGKDCQYVDLFKLNYIKNLRNLKGITMPMDWVKEDLIPSQVVNLHLSIGLDYKAKFNWPEGVILSNIKKLTFNTGNHNYNNISIHTPNVEAFGMNFESHRNEKFITELSKLEKIKYIEFFNVKSMDIFSPFETSPLEEIYLRGYQGRSFPIERIGNAKNLQHININGLSAPLTCDVFKELPKLETLSLDVHRLENEQALLEIPTLKEVEILYAYDEEERKQDFIKQCQEKRPDINIGSEIQIARRRKRAIDYS